MILIDFSSILHRCVYTSVSRSGAKKVDGQYITSEFVPLTKHYILQALFDIKTEYGAEYGDVVICIDRSTAKGYWRKDVYAGYKSKRKKGRELSEINFGEVFEHINVLIEQMADNLPWKVIVVPRAEADDTMLVLAKEYSPFEKILIHSPDKDMIQAQRDDNVYQYSALTKKWLTGDTKSDNMTAWIQEHCILGDAGDEVPKVVDHTEFSDCFIKYINENNPYDDILTPMDFRKSKLSEQEKIELITNFDVYKLNRKGESTGDKDVYKVTRFGPTTLQKKIKEFGSVDNWLDSHPLYREHFDRNFTLVMAEGIPEYIREGILKEYKEASTEYNFKEFEDYLIENNLKSILMDLPRIFTITKDLSASDYGW